jgi:hypothetical protein
VKARRLIGDKKKSMKKQRCYEDFDVHLLGKNLQKKEIKMLTQRLNNEFSLK